MLFIYCKRVNELVLFNKLRKKASSFLLEVFNHLTAIVTIFYELAFKNYFIKKSLLDLCIQII